MERQNGYSDRDQSAVIEALRDLMAYALDLFGDIERCVQSLPLDERDSLTIADVVADAREDLLAYYEAILQRLNTTR